MASSALHVWAVVLLSSSIQNSVMYRFRNRSDAEACLRLLQRMNPGTNYTIMYFPTMSNMKSIPTEWAMFDEEGNAEVTRMMRKVYLALSKHPLPKIRKLLQKEVALVAECYPEVYDTDVRETIEDRLTRWACEIHELSEFSVSSRYWDL